MSADTNGSAPAANKLFQEGRKQLENGNLAEACDLFARSQTLAARVGTLLNLGECEERRSRLATAWGAFVEAKTLAARTADKRQTEAVRRAAALESKLAHVTIAASEIPGLAIRSNGAAVDAATWNIAVPIDAGLYLFEANAPGFLSWRETITIVDGTATVVNVVLNPAPALSKAPEIPNPVPAAAPDLPQRFGIGVLAGITHRERPVGGVRGIVDLWARGGKIRASGSVMYSRYSEDVTPTDQDPITVPTQTIYVGMAFDYLYSPMPQIAVGIGLGIAAEIDRTATFTGVLNKYPARTDYGGQFSLRGTPVILRFNQGAIEVSLHLDLAFAGSEPTLFGLAGVDWML